MSDVVEGLRSVSVHIRDIKRSHKFYTEVLGLKAISFSEEFSRGIYELPGTTTVLSIHVKGADEGGREPGTVTGIVFLHHDPVAACAEIRRRGGTITDEPATVNRPGVRFTIGVVADPDGNEFVIRGKD